MPRSSFYYKEKRDDSRDFLVMNLIDKIYTEHPYYGVRRIKHSLEKVDEIVNHKKISRFMKKMGISAIYPKPNLSLANKEHVKYPYLLGNLNINKSNQVWASDITYIKMSTGFAYLNVVMDWHSRYILSYSISNVLSNDFCIDALNEALEIGTPKIFNTDQGVQYTSKGFIDILKEAKIKISMNSKGRALDNIFVERFWRSIKQENIYINDYRSMRELKAGIENYIAFYNYERPHQSLGYKTPYEVYQKDWKGGFSLCRMSDESSIKKARSQKKPCLSSEHSPCSVLGLLPTAEPYPLTRHKQDKKFKKGIQ